MRRARLLGLLALPLLVGCVHAVPLPREAEPYQAHTDDGWTLALVRYRPQGPPRGLPVVLVPGISANARNMDLDAQHSLARWLAAHGREAWTVSLRASGDSDGPDPAQGRPNGFDFDAYWQHDLPAVLATVRAASGAKAVDYVGHSMGGMVLYAYLAEGGQGINAAATLGSPTRLDWGTGLVRLLRAGARPLLHGGWMLPSSLGAHLAAPLAPCQPDGPLERFFYNPQSTSLQSWQRLIAYGTADVSSGVARQLLDLVESGRFASADGRRDFRADLARVRTPVLVVAAKLDRIALTPAVRDGYRALGGPKAWLLITRANGARGEYGHMDLVIGDRAADEVWTKVLSFLNQHAPTEP